ncbi:MAG: acetate--CoA ligase family protein [Sulfolobales archaeon]|nr:acetate--CoA ligase family protein [Sulfolobales archaeon]MDW8082424.1 acetate--CoA ligase family protein [Sulfolobales archaeon]
MREAREIVEKAKLEGRRKLLEHESMRLCELYGLPVAKYGLATSEKEAVAIAREIGFPVVLKVVSPDISHKTDVGGVVLGINSVGEVSDAYKTIVANVAARAPGSRISGILVQKMVERDIEVIVGGIRDRVFGPVVMFGLGGVFVEVLKDVSFRIAPLTELDVEEMIREIKGYKILEGYRGSQPRDIEALKNLILKLASIISDIEEIEAIDLNPVILYPRGIGALIIDARTILGE